MINNKLLLFILSLPQRVAGKLVRWLPYFRFIRETSSTQTPISFPMWFRQQILGVNKGPYWPVHPSSIVGNWQNMMIGIETSPGYMPGCYIQGMGKLYIGDYTQIGPNVGIITGNHLLTDNRHHTNSEVHIGRYCWLGMGSVILPNVTLGEYTIVAAGAIVTQSFPDGYCVLAGVPAKMVKKLDPAECVHHKSEYEYHGYIPAHEFDAFRKANLNV